MGKGRNKCLILLLVVLTIALILGTLEAIIVVSMDTDVKAKAYDEISTILEADQVKERVPARANLNIDADELIRAIKVFGELQSETENSLISPLSINMALAIVGNGANGDTLKELESFEGKNLDALNEEYKGLMKSSESNKSLSIANSLWINTNKTNIDIKDEALNRIKSLFDAEVNKKDFLKEDVVALINKWCSDKTNGMIENVADGLSDDTVTAIINAIYFNGTWSDSFDKNQTMKKDFTLKDRTKTQCEMMAKTDKDVSYYENSKAQAVSKVYRSGDIFTAILPKESMLDENGQCKIGDLDIAELLKSKQNVKETYIEMPKFKYEFESDIIGALKKLGVTSCFDSEKADFSNLFDIHDGSNICIDKIKHLTSIDMNEEGTEASAVTYISMVNTTALVTEEPKVAEIVLDRPFYYMITTPTGEVMFIGELVNPNK